MTIFHQKKYITVATTRPSILVLWSLKHHKYFFVPSREKGNCFSLFDGTIEHPSQHFFFNKLVVSQDVLCLLYTFMYGLRTHHSPTQNTYSRKFKKAQFLQKKWCINPTSRTNCVLKIPNTPQFIQQIYPVSQNIWEQLEKTITWCPLSVHYASQILASPPVLQTVTL